ncbi:MAG: type III pantothenate kinase [Candidatus Margulisiibacteriota bacterium]
MKYAFVDIGNTAIKTIVYEDGKALSSMSVGRDTQALTLFFKDCDIAQYFISSVVPSINQEIQTINPQAIFLNHEHFSELKINVSPKDSVGIDRLVNAYAVKEKWGRDAFIIDIGTCVTVCHVKSNGDYYGGIIMPGFEMIRNALYQGAEQLPLIDFPNVPPKVIGLSTKEAMSSGIYYGAIHMINGFIRDIKSKWPDHYIILTGGLPTALVNQINYDEFVPNLQFQGLEALYDKFKKNYIE